jgi:PAS domain S-box-containing protein
MDTDRNLLFGVLALQADLIDTQQFIDACLLWTARKDVSIADLLIERGWMIPADKDHVEYLLGRKLQKHGGDPRASLAAIPDDVKRSLAAVDDCDIQRSIAGLPGVASTATVDYVPGQSERYCRLRLHATGGIGRVWLAHDNQLGRDVALKELRPERAEHATLGARFLQEAHITGQLEHPGVIPVYELVRGHDGRQPFYTMRFVKGRTLREAASAFHEKRLAGQEDPLGLPALLNAFATVCNTVAYAHSRGVIHRDLKGQNVVLGDFGEVVVLDWGLAKLVGRPTEAPEDASVVAGDAGADSGYTMQGQALGTPAYMAPEQSSGSLERIDQRTDVYGLGAILYEILTGVPPFRADSTDEVLRKVREEEPIPPRQLWPGVPPALEALCLRALAKQPADRPASATELAQEIQGWQEFERRKAEDALRESEALYHSLVENLPCVVLRKDTEGRFTFANHCFCDVVCSPLDQVLGRTDFDFFPAELAEKYRRDDRQVMESAGVFEVIEPTPMAGRMTYWHVLKTAVRDAAGKVTGVQLIGWDITERKLADEELRKSRERFELAVQGSQDGLWDWDLTTGEVYYSPRYKAMLGYTDDEFPRQSEERTTSLEPPEPGLLHPDDLDRVRAALSAEAEGRENLSWLEFRMRHKDGSYRWIRSRAFILRDANGRIYRKAGSHEDITERKLAEEGLAHERYLARSLTDTSPDFICFKDREGRYTHINPAFYAKLGLSDPAQVIGKTVHDLFDAEYARQAQAEEEEIIRTGKPVVSKDVTITWRDGRATWGSMTKMPLRDPQGQIIGTFAVARDITARKLAEEELRKSQERFELAVQGSQDGLWDWDVTTDEVYYSPRYKAMLGYEDHEFPNRSEGWASRVHPEDIGRVRSELRAHFKSREPLSWVEFRMRHKDGSYRWIRSRAFVLRDSTGRVHRMAGSHEDITDRKNAEGELAQERHLLRSFIDALPEGIYFKDRDSRIIRANNAVAETLGCTPAQLVGKTDFDLFAPASARESFEDEQRIIRTGQPIVAKDEKVTWPGGLTLWVSTTKMPLRDPEGHIIGTFGITRDITKRKLAEETLRQSEERYRSVVAVLHDGIVLLDAQGNIRDCNAAAERILGLSTEQIMGRTPHDPRWRAILEDGSPIPVDSNPALVTLRTGRPCTGRVMGVHKPDGTLTWVTVNSQPLFEADGRTLAGVAASFEDITQRKQTEELLRKAQEELARCLEQRGS